MGLLFLKDEINITNVSILTSNRTHVSSCEPVEGGSWERRELPCAVWRVIPRPAGWRTARYPATLPWYQCPRHLWRGLSWPSARAVLPASVGLLLCRGTVSFISTHKMQKSGPALRPEKLGCPPQGSGLKGRCFSCRHPRDTFCRTLPCPAHSLHSSWVLSSDYQGAE